MRIIKPIAITDTILSQADGSDIPEPDTTVTPAEAIYVAETTYHTGDQVIVLATHRVYESISIANHSGNYPPTDILTAVPKWMEIGATNRWKAFDGKIGSKASQTTSISYHLHIPVLDSIAFLGLFGMSVSIIVTDSGDVEVYNKTINLINNDAVVNWYTYFFEEIIYREDLVLFDLPSAYGNTLDIVVTYTGGIVEIGEIIIGTAVTIGITRESPPPSVSIKDYSNKSTDDFGNFIIVQRAYSKRLDCNLFIYNTQLDAIYNIFAEYRSTPLVWIGNDSYGSMIVYGFYKELDIVIPYILFSEYSLSIEGLT